MFRANAKVSAVHALHRHVVIPFLSSFSPVDLAKQPTVSGKSASILSRLLSRALQMKTRLLYLNRFRKSDMLQMSLIDLVYMYRQKHKTRCNRINNIALFWGVDRGIKCSLHRLRTQVISNSAWNLSTVLHVYMYHMHIQYINQQYYVHVKLRITTTWYSTSAPTKRLSIRYRGRRRL